MELFMGIKIKDKISYKGEKAVSIENEILHCTILPQRGAKIVSLKLKVQSGPSNYVEALSQISTEEYRVSVEYDRPFIGEDGSGFDDMLPNIDTCNILDESGQSIHLPDHGEVWSRPWEQVVSKDAVCFTIKGTVFPYSFTKVISLHENEMVVNYSIDNKSAYRIPFQWAAHALFKINTSCKLNVPEHLTSIYNVHAGTTLPEAPKVYSFPYPFEKESLDLRVMPKKNNQGAQKYWFSDPLEKGECGIIDFERELKTSLHFNPKELPWLGIWVNEGGWHNGYNIGIEPSTCWLDSPLDAMRSNRASFLNAWEKKNWDIRIKLEQF